MLSNVFPKMVPCMR